MQCSIQSDFKGAGKQVEADYSTIGLTISKRVHSREITLEQLLDCSWNGEHNKEEKKGEVSS